MSLSEVPGNDGLREEAGLMAAETAPGEVQLIIRLQDGQELDGGVFGADEARTHAEALIRELNSGADIWPFVAGRYLRPETVASIDLHEGQHHWGGSTGRARWGGTGQHPG